MKLLVIKTLGCKVNQYESDGIAANLLSRGGWRMAGPGETANLCIINTCAVTAKASMQSRQTIRKLIKENQQARIIVTGCHAQIEPDLIRSIQHVDIVVGHADKYLIPEKVLSDDLIFNPIPVHENKQHLRVCSDTGFNLFDPVVTGEMTRAYLKIQDGCDAFCTYCIVPYARGTSRSMPENKVLDHLYRLRAHGFKEAILTGIHTGLYGKDLKKRSSLVDLLKRIIREKPIHRIRLSSIEPAEITDELIELTAEHKTICRHFHIPLQSGDDDILKAMKRPYDTAFYQEQVTKIHEKISGVCIGADVMVGFPGETEAAFEVTYRFLQRLPVSYLHVFPYSARKGTKAYDFPCPVDPDIVRKRCTKLRHLAVSKKRQFIDTQINQRLEGIVQHKSDSETGKLKAITDNYIPVLLENTPHLKGCIVEVIPVKRDLKNHVTGTVVI